MFKYSGGSSSPPCLSSGQHVYADGLNWTSEYGGKAVVNTWDGRPTRTISTETFHVSCQSQQFHPIYKYKENGDVMRYGGMMLFQFNRQGDWFFPSGVHCKAGYIYLASSDSLSDVYSDYGQIHCKLFKRLAGRDIEAQDEIISSRFSIQNGVVKFHLAHSLFRDTNREPSELEKIWILETLINWQKNNGEQNWHVSKRSGKSSSQLGSYFTSLAHVPDKNPKSRAEALENQNTSEKGSCYALEIDACRYSEDSLSLPAPGLSNVNDMRDHADGMPRASQYGGKAIVKNKDGTQVISTKTFHVSCQSLQFHPIYKRKKNGDAMDYGGIVLFRFNGQDDWHFPSGVHCKTGYIYFASDDSLQNIKSKKGVIHGRVFTRLAGQDIDANDTIIGSGFAIRNGVVKFNSGTLNVGKDSFHDIDVSTSEMEKIWILETLINWQKNNGEQNWHVPDDVGKRTGKTLNQLVSDFTNLVPDKNPKS